MLFALILFISLVSDLECNSSAQKAHAILQFYSHQFQVLQSVKNQQFLSQNITFNTTRQKYFFAYWPLMEKCLSSIGEDFQPLLDSFAPSGIGAAGYGVAAGLKIALQVGLWKTGILGLLQTSAASLFSLSALPVALGVGTVAYIYNKNQQDKIKAKCSKVIESFEEIVRSEELVILVKAKETTLQNLLIIDQKLSQVNQKQIESKTLLKNYQSQVGYLNSKARLQEKYFLYLKKITGH